jgi:hypothetical protein
MSRSESLCYTTARYVMLLNWVLIYARQWDLLLQTQQHCCVRRQVPWLQAAVLMCYMSVRIQKNTCTKKLTWFVNRLREGCEIYFRSSSHLVCFLFVVPLLKRLFVHFTVRNLCIILTSDYCNKRRHIKPPKIITYKIPTRFIASAPSSWNTKYRVLQVSQHRAVRNTPTDTTWTRSSWTVRETIRCLPIGGV